MTRPRDFYRTLGVPRTATQKDIQRAYRKLARELHPDVNKAPHAEDRFKDVSEAYDVLSDPEQRRRYDAFGTDFRRVPDDVDPQTRAGRTHARAGAGAGDVDFDDIFGDIYGGGRAGTGRGGPRGWTGGWGPMPGADQEAPVEISVEAAHHGTRQRLTVTGPDGRRTIEVTVPPGVTDGQRIRLAGQGGRGTEGGPAGDLYLVVSIQPDSRYRVEGRDIYVQLPLTPGEAALGTTVPLETPGGEAKVKVPPGTSCGRRLRLRGQGLPNPSGPPGHLFAEVQIMVPPKPTEEERRLFEQLAAVSDFDPRRQR
jgi:curved DNA-binding protein